MTADRIAHELGIAARSVGAVISLAEGGATVPFIARYRKEATGGLDEVQIRDIFERRLVLLELQKRRKSVLAAIEEQGLLTDALRRRIEAADTRAVLEDLYLPFKKKRKTRASVAKERGLEPLARLIWSQPSHGDPWAEARRAVRGEVKSAEEAMAGASDIVAEHVAEHAEVRATVREQCRRFGVLQSKVARGKKAERSKFEQYYDHREPVSRLASHRFLAMSRGEREGFLTLKVTVDEERLQEQVLRGLRFDTRSPFAAILRGAVVDGLKRLALPSVERELRAALKERADDEAASVFAGNLEGLLLAPPVGQKPVVGVDPGIRTGCKCVAVDGTGQVLGKLTINPARDGVRARRELGAFVARHAPYAVAVGNGTYGRETLAVLREALDEVKLSDRVMAVEVSEAGASVYSASDVARAELPDLDVSVRGAVSIARRLQDPLAELVKIDPQSIGVGQYQHDLKPALLTRKLGEVVETCVNRVGVALNTASPSLLSHVAGIGPKLAARIVAHRDQKGPFRRRADLKAVPGLGAKTYEQAAGFLRVRGGPEPLDGSAVHPERYALVGRIARDLGVSVREVVGNAALAGRIDPARYVGDGVGEPTLRDIKAELARPGRDPRPPFEPPKRRDDVRTLADLVEGMVLEGVVTNVTTFGAFVDVGVKQDGLVHVSQLVDRFVRDPAEVVSVGQRLPVKVLAVDLVRQRISLSAKQAQGVG